MAGVAARAQTANVPMNALIEVTGRCHLDCVHCYLDIKNPVKNEMTLEEIKGVFDSLRDAGTMFLTITGGEIFLRRDIFEIMEAARERKFSFRLYTSGTLLNRKKIARIAALKPTAVEISIYGMRSSAHDAITQRKGSLRKSLRAAVLLRQAGIPVAIKSPIMEGTNDSHFELIDAAKRLGAGYTIDPSIMGRRDGGLEPIAVRATVDSLVKLFKNGEIPNPVGCAPPPSNPDDAPCAIGRRTVRISPDGGVYPCGAFPTAAGNIREQSFEKIWRESPLLQEIRGITQKDLAGECSGCSRDAYCGRCSAMALLEHGNFAGPSIEACERAEAREIAAEVPRPPNAHHMAIDASTMLGRRDIGQLIPVGNLMRRTRLK